MRDFLIRLFVVLLPVGLFIYFSYNNIETAYEPKYIKGTLIDYTCWTGRAKGELDLFIKIEKIEKISTHLFGRSHFGWNECDNLKLENKIGTEIIIGQTRVDWDYLKIDGVEIHSLKNVIKKITDNRRTVWAENIDPNVIVDLPIVFMNNPRDL